MGKDENLPVFDVGGDATDLMRMRLLHHAHLLGVLGGERVHLRQQTHRGVVE